MHQCYRVEDWTVARSSSGAVAKIKCTTHPSNTNLHQLLRLAFPHANASMIVSKFTLGSFLLGKQGEFRFETPVEGLEEFLSLLKSPISVCDDCDASHCLDLYRTPVEDAESTSEWPYTETGLEVFRAKYRGDAEAASLLTSKLQTLAGSHPCIASALYVCAMPPSSNHGFGPDLPASWVGPVADSIGALVVDLARTREVASQKEMADAGQRKTNQAGSMKCDSSLNGQPVLVLDDLYMEGETMSEAVRALRAAGASAVYGLCSVKTPKGTQGLNDLLDG